MKSKYNNLKNLGVSDFRRLSGVHPETFKKMLKVLRVEKRKISACGGRKRKLSLPNQLLLCLEYLREGRTFCHIAVSYGVSETTAWRIQGWVEKTLMKSREFTLPGKKVLLEPESDIKSVLIDVSECPIERPKKKKNPKNRKNLQRGYYSGKKKKHTIKSQIVVDKKSELILCTEFSKGKEHDFTLFKNSQVHIADDIKALVDSGYTGIDKIHSNTDIPKKKSKYKPLSKQDKKRNREISSERVLVENVFARIKKFKIFYNKYRCRRKRFGLRFNLICSIQNFELQFACAL